jgi:aspartate/tyrosine/aromatic aminotransferase
MIGISILAFSSSISLSKTRVGAWHLLRTNKLKVEKILSKTCNVVKKGLIKVKTHKD